MAAIQKETKHNLKKTANSKTPQNYYPDGHFWKFITSSEGLFPTIGAIAGLTVSISIICRFLLPYLKEAFHKKQILVILGIIKLLGVQESMRHILKVTGKKFWLKSFLGTLLGIVMGGSLGTAISRLYKYGFLETKSSFLKMVSNFSSIDYDDSIKHSNDAIKNITQANANTAAEHNIKFSPKTLEGENAQLQSNIFPDTDHSKIDLIKNTKPIIAEENTQARSFTTQDQTTLMLELINNTENPTLHDYVNLLDYAQQHCGNADDVSLCIGEISYHNFASLHHNLVQ